MTPLRPLLTRATLALSLAAAIAPIAHATSGEERAHAAGSSLIGTPAPRLVLTTIDGERIDLGALYGKRAVYLKFWATWCVPCREQMPHFERTYRAAGADLAVIAVDVGFNDSIADVRAYRRTVGLTMPIVIDDGRLAAALNLRVTPQHIVIGRDGRILYIGHLADASLDAALASARHGAEPATATPRRHPKEPRYAVGSTLPPLSGVGVDGAAVPITAGGAGRPTVLVFLSPWCESYLAESRPKRAAACRSVREAVESLARESRARFVGIASGLWATREDLAAYRREQRIEIPLVLDESGALFRAFGVTNVPTLLLVDDEARIVRRVDGPDPHLGAEVGKLAAQ